MNHYHSDFSHVINKYLNIYKRAIYYNEHVENILKNIEEAKNTLKPEIREMYNKIDKNDYKIDNLQIDLKKLILLRFKEDILKHTQEEIKKTKKEIKEKDFLIPISIIILVFSCMALFGGFVFYLFLGFKGFSSFLKEMVYLFLIPIIISSIEFLIRIIIRPIKNKRIRKNSYINFTNNIEDTYNYYYEKIIAVDELLSKQQYKDARSKI